MWRFNETQWKVLLKGLRIIGVAGCAVSCVSLLALIGYYSAVRSHAPDADSGWTIPLPWTGWLRAYGTAQENTVILRVFAMFFRSLYCSRLPALSESISQKDSCT
jgi:hypothetical protein